jgi:hypothetical protein
LQNEGCGDLVDDLAMLPAFAAGLVENPVGLASGQSLVPEMNRQTGQFAKLAGKYLRLLRAITLFTGKVQRVADNNACHRESPRQAGKGTHVLARIPSPFECEHGLSRQTEFV